MSKFKAIIFARKKGKVILSRTRNIKITTWLSTGFALGMGVGVLNATFSIIGYNQQLNIKEQLNKHHKKIIRQNAKQLKHFIEENADQLTTTWNDIMLNLDEKIKENIAPNFADVCNTDQIRQDLLQMQQSYTASIRQSIITGFNDVVERWDDKYAGAKRK